MIKYLLPLALLISPALARDNGQWDDVDPVIKAWYAKLKQPDNPTVSCCGEADAYYADSFEVQGDQYVAIITDERKPEEVQGRPPIPIGTRILVPNFKIKFNEGNPTGHGIIFLSQGSTPVVYCFLPPGGI